MGKIRVKTLGDEKQEKQEKKKAQQRAEAKKLQEENKVQKEVAAEKAAQPKEAAAVEVKTENKSAKELKKKAAKTQKHSSKYLAVAENVEKSKTYSLDQALGLLQKLQRVKFDETVELHINTQEKGISGSIVLPHGTGKQTRIVIANFSNDPKGVEDLVKRIEGGYIDFDILIATPESMPRLAKVARILGPRGLMPNPKNGTVSPKPQEVAKKYEGGQVNFKTEAKFPILHLSVGKVSFGEKKLADNIKAAINVIQTKNIKNATLKSTMSPGIKLDTASILY